MADQQTLAPYSEREITLTRVLDAPRSRVWAAWTEPELLMQWFTPAPWRTTDAEIDPRPGGIFRSVMEGPDGERNENAGCVLEVEPGRRFVWTSVFGPGFVPLEVPADGLAFTAIIEFEPVADGTRVRASSTARRLRYRGPASVSSVRRVTMTGSPQPLMPSSVSIFRNIHRGARR